MEYHATELSGFLERNGLGLGLEPGSGYIRITGVAKNCSGCSGAGAATITAPAAPRRGRRPWGGRSSDYWLVLICIHYKTYGSENKNKQKLEHIVYKKLPKVTQVYYTANAMMRNKIYTLSILIVPNSFTKNLSEA